MNRQRGDGGHQRERDRKNAPQPVRGHSRFTTSIWRPVIFMGASRESQNVTGRGNPCGCPFVSGADIMPVHGQRRWGTRYHRRAQKPRPGGRVTRR